MKLPTKDEISPSGGEYPDEKYALENFYGKNLDEAAALFFRDSLYFGQDLLWMGPVGFAFYFPSLEPYVLSEESAGDPNIVNVIVSTIGHRLEFDPASILLCRSAIIRVLNFILVNCSKFEVDPVLCNGVANRIFTVYERVRKLNSIGD